MNGKVITLPAPEEIMTRLTEVLDEHTMRERFYPFIARHGGAEKNAYGVVNIFALAIYDFMQGGYPPVLSNVLYMWMPHFIEAIVDDQEVATQAKSILDEVLKQLRG